MADDEQGGGNRSSSSAVDSSPPLPYDGPGVFAAHALDRSNRLFHKVSEQLLALTPAITGIKDALLKQGDRDVDILHVLKDIRDELVTMRKNRENGSGNY